MTTSIAPPSSHTPSCPDSSARPSSPRDHRPTPSHPRRPRPAPPSRRTLPHFHPDPNPDPPPGPEPPIPPPADLTGLPPILTVPELAALLRVERKTVYNLITQGDLPGVRRLGKTIRISRDAVLRWLSEGQGRVSRSRRSP